MGLGAKSQQGPGVCGAECGEAVGGPSWQECRAGVSRMGEETPGKWLGPLRISISGEQAVTS